MTGGQKETINKIYLRTTPPPHVSVFLRRRARRSQRYFCENFLVFALFFLKKKIFCTRKEGGSLFMKGHIRGGSLFVNGQLGFCKQWPWPGKTVSAVVLLVFYSISVMFKKGCSGNSPAKKLSPQIKILRN